MTAESRSGLRARLAHWVAPQERVHAEQEQAAAVRLGGTPVAELYDGTGSLSLIWLGRRQIAGVEPGRRMRVEGLVTQSEGRPVLFNPRYELVPLPGE